MRKEMSNLFKKKSDNFPMCYTNRFLRLLRLLKFLRLLECANIAQELPIAKYAINSSA